MFFEVLQSREAVELGLPGMQLGAALSRDRTQDRGINRKRRKVMKKSNRRNRKRLLVITKRQEEELLILHNELARIVVTYSQRVRELLGLARREER